MGCEVFLGLQRRLYSVVTRHVGTKHACQANYEGEEKAKAVKRQKRVCSVVSKLGTWVYVDERIYGTESHLSPM